VSRGSWFFVQTVCLTDTSRIIFRMPYAKISWHLPSESCRARCETEWWWIRFCCWRGCRHKLYGLLGCRWGKGIDIDPALPSTQSNPGFHHRARWRSSPPQWCNRPLPSSSATAHTLRLSLASSRPASFFRFVQKSCSTHSTRIRFSCVRGHLITGFTNHRVDFPPASELQTQVVNTLSVKQARDNKKEWLSITLLTLHDHCQPPGGGQISRKSYA
jgi:hypothetical protein